MGRLESQLQTGHLRTGPTHAGSSIKKFVVGPWKAEYGLGTYGVDPKTNTAWAVINYNSDFAVAGFQNHQDQDHRGLE